MTDEKSESSEVILYRNARGNWMAATDEDANAVLIVDPIEAGNVEVGPFLLDDAQLARLTALLESGATVLLKAREAEELDVIGPAEMQDIQDAADRIRETLGERAAKEYIEERTGGAI